MYNNSDNNDNNIRVLLVDDERMSFDMLTGMFAGQPGVTIRFVSDPAAVLEVAHAFEPSVMLVDLRMPGTDGIDLIRKLRSDPLTATVPLLMLSVEVDPRVKAAGFAVGAADYLVKWPDRVELTARVRAHSDACHVARERDRAAAALADSRNELLHRTEQLALAQAALHEAQKMEAIGKLAGVVAHDVNNILHIINGHLQLMRLERADERSLRRIDAATEGIRRGTQLTAQLLATARGKSGSSERIELASFLRGIEATVFNPRDAQPCRLQLAEGGHYASLDPIELQKVLVELVRNAREATTGECPVTIVLDTEQVSNRAGHVPVGSYVRICVVDQGSGMEPDVQRRAFEPFFTTKSGVQGAGLGLSLAAGFVRKHRGHIELKTGAGEGTRVTLRFPCCPA
jgi:signal transduction histidine kinase